MSSQLSLADFTFFSYYLGGEGWSCAHTHLQMHKHMTEQHVYHRAWGHRTSVDWLVLSFHPHTASGDEGQVPGFAQ